MASAFLACLVWASNIKKLGVLMTKINVLASILFVIGIPLFGSLLTVYTIDTIDHSCKIGHFIEKLQETYLYGNPNGST